MLGVELPEAMTLPATASQSRNFFSILKLFKSPGNLYNKRQPLQETDKRKVYICHETTII